MRAFCQYLNLSAITVVLFALFTELSGRLHRGAQKMAMRRARLGLQPPQKGDRVCTLITFLLSFLFFFRLISSHGEREVMAREETETSAEFMGEMAQVKLGLS